MPDLSADSAQVTPIRHLTFPVESLSLHVSSESCQRTTNRLSLLLFLHAVQRELGLETDSARRHHNALHLPKLHGILPYECCFARAFCRWLS